ncbi:MAG TPA: hypothetical protein VIY51_10460 [Xanthobacteraceae bacterium]
MLRTLASWTGRRAAAFAALAYLACVVMPSVALALAPGAISAYCFDEIAEEVAALQAKAKVHVHVHSDGTVHVHDHGGATSSATHHGQGENQSAAAGQGHSHSHPGTHDASCCGVFGFTAVLPALSGAIGERAAYHIRAPIPTDCLVGRSPPRIDRPPIVSLTI